MIVGDVVYLKSGSPKLTVISAEKQLGDEIVRVSWIDKDGQLRTADLPKSCVQLEDPSVQFKLF